MVNFHNRLGEIWSWPIIELGNKSQNASSLWQENFTAGHLLLVTFEID